MTERQGQAAEQLARTWLEQQGLQTICCNFTVRGGEIDLVMRDHDTLVMVEVRHRTRAAWGNASESITATKRQRLTRAATAFLQRDRKLQRLSVRFDVLALDGQLECPRISWLRDAFRGS